MLFTSCTPHYFFHIIYSSYYQCNDCIVLNKSFICFLTSTRPTSKPKNWFYRVVALLSLSSNDVKGVRLLPFKLRKKEMQINHIKLTGKLNFRNRGWYKFMKMGKNGHLFYFKCLTVLCLRYI